MDLAYAPRSHVTPAPQADQSHTVEPECGLAFYARGTEEAADLTVERLGGPVSLNEVYGAGFADDFHLLVAEFEQVASRAADLLEHVPEDARREFHDVLWGTVDLETALYDAIWANVAGGPAPDADKVLDACVRLATAVQLLDAMSDFSECHLALGVNELFTSVGTWWVTLLASLHQRLSRLDVRVTSVLESLEAARDDLEGAGKQAAFDLAADGLLLAGAGLVGVTNPWLLAVVLAGRAMITDYSLGPDTGAVLGGLAKLQQVTSGVATAMANDQLASEAFRTGWTNIRRAANGVGLLLDAAEIGIARQNLLRVRDELAALSSEYLEVHRAWTEALPLLVSTTHQLDLLHHGAARGRALLETRHQRVVELRSAHGDALFEGV